MKENISVNETARHIFARHDVNLASLTLEQQEQLLKQGGLHNSQELEAITQQLFASNVQHFDYEDEEELEYDREEDYLEQEESEEEEECYEDLSSTEQEYQYDELTNSERIESSKTILVELFNLLNTREIANQNAEESLKVSIWISEIKADLEYMIRRAQIPVRERSYSETDLLQRKKEDCHDHVMDFTPGQVKVIAIIERIVHYLNECFNETKYIFNSPLVFKRVRDYVSG